MFDIIFCLFIYYKLPMSRGELKHGGSDSEIQKIHVAIFITIQTPKKSLKALYFPGLIESDSKNLTYFFKALVYSIWPYVIRPALQFFLNCHYLITTSNFLFVSYFKCNELALALLRIEISSFLLLQDKILTKSKILTNKSIPFIFK